MSVWIYQHRQDTTILIDRAEWEKRGTSYYWERKIRPEQSESRRRSNSLSPSISSDVVYYCTRPHQWAFQLSTGPPPSIIVSRNKRRWHGRQARHGKCQVTRLTQSNHHIKFNNIFSYRNIFFFCCGGLILLSEKNIYSGNKNKLF